MHYLLIKMLIFGVPGKPRSGQVGVIFGLFALPSWAALRVATRNRPTKGGSETTNGEGPAYSLVRGVCYPLSSLPAGPGRVLGPPRT